MQLYVSDVDASVPVPVRQLQGFTRLHLQPGESREVSFALTPEQMVCYTDDGRPLIEPAASRSP